MISPSYLFHAQTLCFIRPSRHRSSSLWWVRDENLFLISIVPHSHTAKCSFTSRWDHHPCTHTCIYVRTPTQQELLHTPNFGSVLGVGAYEVKKKKGQAEYDKKTREQVRENIGYWRRVWPILGRKRATSIHVLQDILFYCTSRYYQWLYTAVE